MAALTTTRSIEVERRRLEGAQLEWYAAAARVKRRQEILLALGWSGVFLIIAGVAYLLREQASVSWLGFAALLGVILASPTFAFRPRRAAAGTELFARVRASRVAELADASGRIFGYAFEGSPGDGRVLFVRDATLSGVRGFPSDDFTLEYFVPDDGPERRALDVRGQPLRPVARLRVDADEDELPEQFALLRGPLESLELVKSAKARRAAV